MVTSATAIAHCMRSVSTTASKRARLQPAEAAPFQRNVWTSQLIWHAGTAGAMTPHDQVPWPHATASNKADNAGKRLDMFILPNPQVVGADARLRSDCSGLGHHQPSATHSA
jgi:hypothetical protein